MFRSTAAAASNTASSKIGRSTTSPSPAAPLTLAQVLARVEQRLRWYGFSDWRIRDAVCLGAAVTVEVRSPRGAIAAFTVARDGGAMSCAVVPAAPVLQAAPEIPVQEAVVPRLARTLAKRALGGAMDSRAFGAMDSRAFGAMGQRAMGTIWPNGRFLSRPALCQG